MTDQKLPRYESPCEQYTYDPEVGDYERNIPPGTPFEVHGIVSGLDVATQRFNINGLVVDYSSAIIDDFPSGQISSKPCG